MYSTQFKKEIVAEEHDLIVKVDRHSSEALFKASIEEGDIINVDRDVFKDGKNLLTWVFIYIKYSTF